MRRNWQTKMITKLLDLLAGLIFLLTVSGVLPITACMLVLLAERDHQYGWLIVSFGIMVAIAWAADRV